MPRAYGIGTTEVAGKSAERSWGQDGAERSRKLDKLVLEARKALPSFEEEFVDRGGNKRVLLTTKSPIRDLSGEIVSVLTTSLDITDRKRAERHLLHLAHHDSLTDLPNRMLLTQKLGMEMDFASAVGGCFALHLIDLDHFKGINDVLGHSVGDRLLSVLGHALQRVVRDTDIVARLGGDEFAILQTRIDGPSDAAELARRIVEVTAQPIDIDGKQIQATGSVGITLFPADGNDADELLKNADLAMYQAKADGGRSFRFYSTDMQAQARDIARLDADLRRRGRAAKSSCCTTSRRSMRRAAHRRRRGAGALAPRRRQLVAAARLPGPRRGERHDRADQRMGAAARLQRRAELAQARPAAHPHRRQHVAGAVPPPERRPADHRHARRNRARAVAAGAGDHREHRDGEHQGADRAI